MNELAYSLSYLPHHWIGSLSELLYAYSYTLYHALCGL